jgi:hypothetical protein
MEFYGVFLYSAKNVNLIIPFAVHSILGRKFNTYRNKSKAIYNINLLSFFFFYYFFFFVNKTAVQCGSSPPY